MADLDLKMSPGTFVEYYRLLDTTHRYYLTRQMSEWDFQKNGHLYPSTDFHDFTAFRRLVEILEKETMKERRRGCLNSCAPEIKKIKHFIF